jgi:hypothetical protein
MLGNRAIAVLLVPCVIGCSLQNAKPTFCTDSGATREALVAKAKLQLDQEEVRPVWSPEPKESFYFDSRYVGLSLTFHAPPLVGADIWFGCDGMPGQVKVTRWGTFSE